jgi:hypothetical protein
MKKKKINVQDREGIGGKRRKIEERREVDVEEERERGFLFLLRRADLASQVDRGPNLAGLHVRASLPRVFQGPEAFVPLGEVLNYGHSEYCQSPGLHSHLLYSVY